MELIVYKNATKSQQNDKSYAVDFITIKDWIKNGKYFFKIFHYRNVTLKTYNNTYISKPFLTFFVLKIISRKPILCLDSFGNTKKVSYLNIANYFFSLIKDFFSLHFLLKKVKSGVNFLFNSIENSPKIDKIDYSLPPLYLRTDQWFGELSGGSIGHIAGVLNKLDNHFPKPLFLSTAKIPTVRKDIYCQIIKPTKFYWDFNELRIFASNFDFISQSLKILNTNKISFIYQRYSLNSYVGTYLSIHLNKPLVIEYNGSEVWISNNWGQPLKHSKLSLAVEELNLKSADLIVVVSEILKKELVQRKFNPEKILVNPNGVDPLKFSPDINPYPLKNKLNLVGKTVIGFIGTFGPWHGAENLTESFAKLINECHELKNNLHLLMIGDGKTLSQVKKLVQKYNIENFVTFTGLIPQDEAPNFLAVCDIFACPHVPNPDGTAFFGSPTKLFEYMAMGKPIIASKLEQIGEILEHNKTAYLVDPGNINNFKDGLKSLIENKNLQAILGSQARKEVISKYTWEIHTKKIITALAENFCE